MNSTLKSLLFWIVLILVALLVYNFSTKLQPHDRPIQFSEFMAKVDSGEVSSVTLVGNEISGTYRNNDS
ncbi:MAG TPA: ATP-dependent metallopeptidase FtsH/Yme1/Tma family protein, partial [Vicinamibacterales bacterium]